MLRFSTVLLAGPAVWLALAIPAFSAGLTEHGKLLFSDDFSTASPAWAGKVGDWAVADGVAKVSEKAEDHHPAVRRHPLKYHNGIFEFKFRFDGANLVSLMLNENGAHVCLLYITPKGMYLQTGKLPGGAGDAVKIASLDKSIAPGEWHTAIARIDGKEFSAQVDGGPTMQGQSARIDVDKVDFGFMVGGVSGSFKDVKVYDLPK